ncbi:SDR family oxidoreductase [Saccharibacillus sp. CPCC 101409]|uniref:SDR family NAD(P)-dependent oxidoreductase n=1 Tax=Saccharibacillus sp. CPCC 101409 TaxID=3058041 RepID=UPI0026727230|nr:SDR family oxidoreductase [Saccharibacillus sp. CPCC 101409]MDO3409280.1 SDR family oxidoreductase [Saccharibacillus sp. CPCC 101409]
MNILITGGSRGIGLAIARELAAAGHRLLLTGRSEQSLAEARSALGEETLVYAHDRTLGGAAEKTAAFARERGFEPDVLILNAASFYDATRSVVEPGAEELERILRANVIANYEWTRTFAPLLEGGRYPRIILIGSTASLRADTSLYGISKAALRNYALGLREELKTSGIGVTLINPGGTFTERRVPGGEIGPDRLLESRDIALLTAALLTLSPQAVVEELTVRPMLGDTF